MAPPHPTTRPPASYKMKLAQDTLYGHNDRDDKETEESVVGGSVEEKKTVTEQTTEQELVFDWLLLVDES